LTTKTELNRWLGTRQAISAQRSCGHKENKSFLVSFVFVRDDVFVVHGVLRWLPQSLNTCPPNRDKAKPDRQLARLELPTSGLTEMAMLESMSKIVQNSLLISDT
jgi:hypothetical protein